MTAPFEIDADKAASMRSHYEGVVRDTLQVLWSGKWLIAATTIGCLLLSFGVLAVMSPQYTGEATLQLNFNREEPMNGVRSQLLASLDAGALVDSQVRLIKSRATASAVVARLGLDRDARFAGSSRLANMVLVLRSALGDRRPLPTPHDLAVNALMRQVDVENQPRSYLISVTATSDDPGKAALLANAVALEYMRATALRNLTEAEAGARAELAAVSLIYGIHHPNYQQIERRLEQLHARIRIIQEAPSSSDTMVVAGGPSLIPADKVLVPSGPNAKLFLAVAGAVGFAGGVWLVRWGQRRRITSMDLLELKARTIRILLSGLSVMVSRLHAGIFRFFAVAGAVGFAGGVWLVRWGQRRWITSMDFLKLKARTIPILPSGLSAMVSRLHAGTFRFLAVAGAVGFAGGVWLVRWGQRRWITSMDFLKLKARTIRILLSGLSAMVSRLHAGVLSFVSQTTGMRPALLSAPDKKSVSSANSPIGASELSNPPPALLRAPQCRTRMHPRRHQPRRPSKP